MPGGSRMLSLPHQVFHQQGKTTCSLLVTLTAEAAETPVPWSEQGVWVIVLSGTQKVPQYFPPVVCEVRPFLTSIPFNPLYNAAIPTNAGFLLPSSDPGICHIW